MFYVEIFLHKEFYSVDFLWFVWSMKLMVDSYNMNEYLERSWCLVYYQILEEPGIAGCNAKPSHRSDIYAWKCTCFFFMC